MLVTMRKLCFYIHNFNFQTASTKFLCCVIVCIAHLIAMIYVKNIQECRKTFQEKNTNVEIAEFREEA